MDIWGDLDVTAMMFNDSLFVLEVYLLPSALVRWQFV